MKATTVCPSSIVHHFCDKKKLNDKQEQVNNMLKALYSKYKYTIFIFCWLSN
jgi:hypothetical protein